MNPCSLILAIIVVASPAVLAAQAPGRWPPDSLINLKVIPKNTPVMQVIGMMRNFAGALGVRCQFCHVGQEGQPLAQFDFAKDEKRTKLVARQMMRMVEEINRRLDTLPHDPAHDHAAPSPPAAAAVRTPLVTCATCHRGVSRPLPLATLMEQTAASAGADSAVRMYRALRQRYYGRDAYDFGELSLNSAAFRLGRAGKYAEAFAMLRLNEELFPNSSEMSVFRGNIILMQGDTNGAAEAFREAVRRDTTNNEARGRLRQIGRQP